MIKAHFSGKLVSSGISDVVIASVYSEKTHLKKLMMIMIMSFNFCYETVARKVIVDFKFDAL